MGADHSDFRSEFSLLTWDFEQVAQFYSSFPVCKIREIINQVNVLRGLNKINISKASNIVVVKETETNYFSLESQSRLLEVRRNSAGRKYSPRKLAGSRASAGPHVEHRGLFTGAGGFRPALITFCQALE